MITLCSPSKEVSCFGCCPPIRPAGYDHLLYVKSLKREFRENRRNLRGKKANPKPIVGFSCWALGYIDEDFRRIGCMLHPGVNGGEDLRHLTGYGTKCARESCLQARVFDRLPHEQKIFWLEPSQGLSSFFYSSPQANPVFHLMLWHGEVLGLFYEYATSNGWNCTELLWQIPFLLERSIHPRAWRMVVKGIIKSLNEPLPLESLPWHEIFLTFKEQTDKIRGIITLSAEKDGALYLHRLDLAEEFRDFLKFFLKINKIELGDAVFLYEQISGIIMNILDWLGVR